jgi:dolichol-phosphate mannosyltransferase
MVQHDIAREAGRKTIRGIAVVVPTRNEAGNVSALLDRIAGLPDGLIGEVLFVDDSDDGTADVIRMEGVGRRFPVRVIHREARARHNGLSGAVIEGLRHATCEWVCVMDGDLQHPPEVIESLAARGENAGAQLVCATRYTDGGDNRGLAFGRSFISRASTHMAKGLFPRALSGVSDPMSGFFLVRRDAVDLDRLRPRGFKILLEILVRQRGIRAAETPYEFDERAWGTTKASMRQGTQFLSHLGTLRARTVCDGLPSARRTLRFAVVGCIGVVVNELTLWLLVRQGISGYLLGAFVAMQAAVMFNFALSHLWVFGHTSDAGSVASRFWRYWSLCNALFLVSLPLLALFVSGLGVNYVVANGMVIGVQFVIRLLVSDRRIWPEQQRPEPVLDLADAERERPQLHLVSDLMADNPGNRG